MRLIGSLDRARGDRRGGRPPRIPGVLAAIILAAATALIGPLAGCQSTPKPAAPPPKAQSAGARLDSAIAALAAPAKRAKRAGRDTKAEGAYRRLVADRLPELLRAAADPARAALPRDTPGVEAPNAFIDIDPVTRSRVREPGLHRAGLGLPTVARMAAGGSNAPPGGFRLPATLIALPGGGGPDDCCRATLVDPDRVASAVTRHGVLPVAMDLEAPLDATAATGSPLVSGLVNLLRPGGFAGRPRIIFLEPFDPNKRPLVLVHGLLSTPHVWKPLVKGLLADPRIRAEYQIWFFYYPTGQPVPLSALQLREALDHAVARYRPRHSIVLIGHSMGGILARAQVSGMTLDDSRSMVGDISTLPEYSLARRSLVFAPRPDVSRVVFMFTPHRGSRLANSGLGAWGIRLIRLPDALLRELGAYADRIAGIRGGRLPTSIHGLSPESPFLYLLDRTPPKVPFHTVVGDRGRGNLANSSDGVVAYWSSHLPGARSEVVVPTGHGGLAHPLAIAELKRILILEAGEARAAN